MTSTGIAAIVVSYRSAETIEACLEALKAASGVEEIRVVDNGSDDGTMDVVQSLSARDARIRFIANPDNPGFATACNQGAQASASPWLAFVNPDLMVERDSLLRLAEAAARNDALMGAVLVDEAGVEDPASRRRAPDFAAMLRDASARRLSVLPNAEQYQRVEAISGALMVISRRVFDEVEGFDAGYRLHAEDLDLCRRVGEAGHAVCIDNAVRVLHLRGVSSKSRPVFVEWHKHRGLWRYYRKFDAPAQGRLTRYAVFAMIWTRFVFSAMGKAVTR
ncbi:glycosyltransferase family 2 protein [Lysobacter soyae]|uniref:Glycosyltransferase family 2 protein n=1 Tax=Lysobacter soyae TaxID=2764185 RepID=A0ABX8WNI7_9GAMM|nr:glycosyltransferase family 2 protein [Lysobacter sp. CJ11]QYR52700.1 glycosyltransferase family 2 protein [Lysobacter sp. CJ11]